MCLTKRCLFLVVEIPSGEAELWDTTGGINDKNPFCKYNIWDHLLSEFIITTLPRMLNSSGTLIGGVRSIGETSTMITWGLSISIVISTQNSNPK